MSSIPKAARKAVADRDQGQCCRCGGAATDVHHRQRRREGGHGVHNLVSLCRNCHSACHARPKMAMETGYIVPTHVPQDEVAQVVLHAFYGPVRLDQQGGVQ